MAYAMTADELLAMIGRGISPTVVGGTRTGSPTTINPAGRKGGVPRFPRSDDPIVQPPAQPPPGTPPGREPVNPPTQPTTPPDRPRPTNPITDPGQPPMPEEPLPDGKGGGPSPTPMPGGDQFAKGQVYPDLMPGGYFSPTAGDFYSDGGFNAYRGANRGIPAPGRAGEYDPLGIGADSYGGGPYGGLPGSSQNVYGLTGVNSVTGYQGPAKYGVVGGQGGYGVGMVGPEYSGPLFDDATGALKAMRRQRRLLNQSTKAVYDGPATAAAPEPGAPTAATPGKTGQPATTGAQPEPALAPNQQPPGKTGQPATGAQQQQAQQPAGSWNPLTTPTSMGNMFETEWGRLVPSSVGNQNVFQLENDPTKLFHYDPAAQNGAGARGGWKSMTPEAYSSYGDYQYKDPRQFGAAANPMMQQWTKKNGLIQGMQGTGAYA